MSRHSAVSVSVSALLAASALVVSSADRGHAAPGAPPPLTFAPLIVLGPDSGGEPSLQDDGHGHVYVTAPAGIATGVLTATGLIGTAPTNGGVLWRSLDGGASFLPRQVFGTINGGGDTDVTADAAQNVYVSDLEAAAADYQVSTDHGANFSPPAQGTPDNDRQWLTPVGTKLFANYHDFAVNVDLIYVSTNQGQTFVPAGTAGKVINPADNPTAATDCANGNLISKPVFDAAGTIYITINCGTAPNNLTSTSTPLDKLYVAISSDGGNSFHTVKAADAHATGGSFGHDFNQMGIDAAGNLYIAASGNLVSGDPYHMYLIRSLDHGVTWKAPISLNADHSQAFPAIAAGQAGQVAVGYYGTTHCQTGVSCSVDDIRSDGNIFQFFVTQTLDGTDPSPSFTTTQVTTTSPHQNGICTDGLFCGTPLSKGGNRNLADFESMAVDPQGHLELAIAADPTNIKTTDTNPTVTWFIKQNGGALMPPGATNGNGTGNHTFVTAASGGGTATPPATTTGATGATGTTGTAGTGLANTARVSSADAGGLAALAAIGLVGIGAAARRRRRQSR